MSSRKISRITRPVGRVRIETRVSTKIAGGSVGITRPVGRVRIETFAQILGCGSCEASPGRLAGCGLKHTGEFCSNLCCRDASPGRLAGCGLKRMITITGISGWGITRPVGRVRIETCTPVRKPFTSYASPGRLAGCGLKLALKHRAWQRYRASPGRLAGCGLKLLSFRIMPLLARHHPAGWPGAD